MAQVLTAPRLGERLLEQGIVTPLELQAALEEQQRCGGGLLGTILCRLGNHNPLRLLHALAEHLQLPFADLLTEPPAFELLKAEHLSDYLDLEAVPWKREANIVWIATPQITERLTSWATAQFGDCRFALTSQRDIHRCLAQRFPGYLSRESLERLWRKTPDLSARDTITDIQFWMLAGVGSAVTLLWILHPLATFITLLSLMNLFCLGTLIFKSLLFFKGLRYRRQVWRNAEAGAEIPDSELPVYTILIPMYDEVNSLPQLLEAIRAIDYPCSRLDVKLVLEADDTPTLEAARALRPEGLFEIITVPPSQPRTKPKACNYALHFARGEFVTIYDAEDRPDPQQLRKVVRLFRNSDDKLVCVQCRLNYYNRKQSLLTGMFAIEYAAWFDYLLPGLDKLKLPIPLGGTSNHINLQRLRELGEWDPYNVTEDADLGIRMAFARYRTATLNSETLEEAPATLWAWMKQRSRWIKGYMQTWLVHMRHPARLFRRLGRDGFWGFQFFIGGPCLVFLSTPLLIVASIYWFHFSAEMHHPALRAALPFSMLTLTYALLLHFVVALEVIRSRAWLKMTPAVCCFPFYWILHSLASFRALWQLLTRPHYWDKTAHGADPTHINNS